MAASVAPGRAHLWLAKAVGSWRVDARYYFAADVDPVEASGTEEIEMFGPYWRRGHLEIELPGSTVRGSTCIGFDPLRQIFVATWLDTANPYLYTYQGRYDEAADALVLEGSNTDPASGKRSLYRSVERRVLPDRRTLELSIEVPGQPETRILTYQFQRT